MIGKDYFFGTPIDGFKMISTQENQPMFGIKEMRMRLANKYNSCQESLGLMAIEALQKGRNNSTAIILSELKYEDNSSLSAVQHLATETTSELRELCEYYRYYNQNPPILIKKFFAAMYNNQQRKKAIEYYRLKAMLNLDLSDNPHNDDSSGYQPTSKEDQRNEPLESRILRELNTQVTDESLELFELKKRLSRCLDKMQRYRGQRSIEEIDSGFILSKQPAKQNIKNWQKPFHRKFQVQENSKQHQTHFRRRSQDNLRSKPTEESKPELNKRQTHNRQQSTLEAVQVSRNMIKPVKKAGTNHDSLKRLERNSCEKNIRVEIAELKSKLRNENQRMRRTITKENISIKQLLTETTAFVKRR